MDAVGDGDVGYGVAYALFVGSDDYAAYSSDPSTGVLGFGDGSIKRCEAPCITGVIEEEGTEVGFVVVAIRTALFRIAPLS